MSQGFNKYSAGSKVYGGGRSAPNVGKTSSPGGYAQRDNAQRTAAINRARNNVLPQQSKNDTRNNKSVAMRNALLRKMKANQQGKFASSAAQTPTRNLFSGPGGY